MVCVWIGLHSSFECVEHNRVVVAVTNNIRNDTSVIQIEDCTQIDFVDFNTFIPFELCNIGKPFYIWLWCMKITLEYIFSHIPCHRVVGTNGSLTGYGGGLARKVQLLALEGVDTTRFFVPKTGTAL